MKKCPYCAEKIQDEAIVCRYCGRDLPQPTEELAKPVKEKTPGLLVILALILGFTLILLIGIVGTLIEYYVGTNTITGVIVTMVYFVLALLLWSITAAHGRYPSPGAGKVMVTFLIGLIPLFGGPYLTYYSGLFLAKRIFKGNWGAGIVATLGVLILIFLYIPNLPPAIFYTNRIRSELSSLVSDVQKPPSISASASATFQLQSQPSATRLIISLTPEPTHRLSGIPKRATRSETHIAHMNRNPWLADLGVRTVDNSGNEVFTVSNLQVNEVLWGSGFCFMNASFLEQNWSKIQFTFSIQGSELPMDIFYEPQGTQDIEIQGRGKQPANCRWLITKLYDWPIGEYELNVNTKIIKAFSDGWGFIPADTIYNEKYYVSVKPLSMLPQPSATRVVQLLPQPSVTRKPSSPTPKPTLIPPTQTNMSCSKGCKNPSPGCTIAAFGIDIGCEKGTYQDLEKNGDLLELASSIDEFIWFCTENEAETNGFYNFGNANCGNPKQMIEQFALSWAPPVWNEVESAACPHGCDKIVNNSCLIAARTDQLYGKIYFTYASSLNALIQSKKYLWFCTIIEARTNGYKHAPLGITQ